jgi:hypothetical protein
MFLAGPRTGWLAMDSLGLHKQCSTQWVHINMYGYDKKDLFNPGPRKKVCTFLLKVNGLRYYFFLLVKC